MPLSALDYFLCILVAMLLAPMLAIASWFFFPLL